MNSLMESLFGRMGNGRQIAIIAVGVIATALVFGVSRWATQPTMVPLYADIPVENVKAMTDKLTESAIVYELDRTGSTILVASADLARARVNLAAEAMPTGGRPGLELFDGEPYAWHPADLTFYRVALAPPAQPAGSAAVGGQRCACTRLHTGGTGSTGAGAGCTVAAPPRAAAGWRCAPCGGPGGAAASSLCGCRCSGCSPT